MLDEPPPLLKKKSNLLRNAVVAVVLLVLLVVVVGYGVQRIQQSVERKRKLNATMADFQKQSAARMRESFDNGTSVEESSEHLAQARQQIAAITEQLPESEKVYLIASQEVLGELQGPLKKYQAAYAVLLESNSTDPAGLKTLEDIEKRKALVGDFAKANEELTKVSASMGKRYRERLIANGLSAERSEKAAAGFLKGMNAQLVALVREDDRQLGVELMALLDLFKESWGQWKLNQDGELEFTADEVAQRHNKHITNIQKIAAHQEATQKKMMAAQERAAAGKSR